MIPKIKRLACILLSFLAISGILPLLPTAAHASTAALSTLSASAESALLMLADEKNVLFEKDADRRLPMASTTKIMTALVALELLSPETVVTVDPSAVGTEGSSVYLVAEEKLTLEHLLYALLLESANDAAVAIAVAASGSVECFAEHMNRKAEALGLSDTHFQNPHGLDDKAHYTTARELALIACEALRNPLIRKITATRKTTIPHPDGETERLLVNHNKLLRTYDGCIGMKTGYTKRSGRCLVSAAERDGVTLVAVTINAYSDWKLHEALLDHGFSLYTARTLCESGEIRHTLPVCGGTDAYVTLSNREALRAILPVSAGEIDSVIECRPFAYATVQAGETYGKAVFYSDTDGDGSSERIGEVALIADFTVEKVRKKLPRWIVWILSLFGWDG